MATTPDRILLRRLADNAIAAAAQGRDAIDVGPFRAFFSRESALIYFNFAVPVADCADWGPPLAELRAAFEARGRVPRFEYFPALWPTLMPALEAAGYRLELLGPVMTLEPEALVEPSLSAASIALLRPSDPLEQLTDFFRVGALGFGMTPPELDEASVAQDRSRLSSGALQGALARIDGVAAACGSLVRSGDIAEMAGVATLPKLRRRGIGAHLCAELLRAGFEAGVKVVWLSAASEGAVALYRGLGFTHAGDQAHISIPR